MNPTGNLVNSILGAGENFSPTEANVTSQENSAVHDAAIAVLQDFGALLGDHVAAMGDRGRIEVVLEKKGGAVVKATCNPEIFYNNVKEAVKTRHGTDKMSELASQVTDRSAYAKAIKLCLKKELDLAKNQQGHSGGMGALAGLIQMLGMHAIPTLKLLTASHFKSEF
ncbi:hypothetical protein SCG7086_BN_00160 [Chlamydiales bacterium SCGC AG-110-P3]|nr:hypothetical protein SCG7086_BN_00160 [Chlamydiales bacterium SCGC AG-110-P3]